ncbi:hypothetical protein GGF50DRAFT_117449 [Schizophyllum commune]
MQSIVVSRASEHLYLLPSLVSSYAERSRSSPTISGDLSRTGPALKQRIDDTRARIPTGSRFCLPSRCPSLPRAPLSPFSSSATLALRPATLFEPPTPLATPSILVSIDFTISRALGADIT